MESRWNLPAKWSQSKCAATLKPIKESPHYTFIADFYECETHRKNLFRCTNLFSSQPSSAEAHMQNNVWRRKAKASESWGPVWENEGMDRWKPWSIRLEQTRPYKTRMSCVAKGLVVVWLGCDFGDLGSILIQFLFLICRTVSSVALPIREVAKDFTLEQPCPSFLTVQLFG